MEDKPIKEELSKKMDFKDVADKRDEFFKESDEFAGKEIEVTFKLDYNGDLNGKEFHLLYNCYH